MQTRRPSTLVTFLSLAAIIVTFSGPPAVSGTEMGLLQADKGASWQLARGAHEDQRLQVSNPLCTYYFGFNTAKAPFDKVLVRKAFIAAIDRESSARILNSGLRPAMTFTPPGIFGYVDGFSEGVGMPYNPAQARQWLADAGYPGGQGWPSVKADFAPGLTGQSDTYVLAQMTANWWKVNLGVAVTVRLREASAFLASLQRGEPQLWYIRWCTGQSDQVDARYYLYDGVNAWRTALGNWSNATYDDLLVQASNTTDMDMRRSFYRQAEAILVETDAVLMPMHYEGSTPGRRVFLPIILR